MAKAFKSLMQTAPADNHRSSAPKSKSRPKAGTEAKTGASKTKPAELLAADNPQIAKPDGDAPVHGYIAGMPRWNRKGTLRTVSPSTSKMANSTSRSYPRLRY